MKPSPQTVTQLLIEWGNGDEAAFEKLMPLIYSELRKRDHRYMARENPGHTLQTTALIHEVYLRLADQKDKKWENRSHFYAVAAQAMRPSLLLTLVHVLLAARKTRKESQECGQRSFVPIDTRK